MTIEATTLTNVAINRTGGSMAQASPAKTRLSRYIIPISMLNQRITIAGPENNATNGIQRRDLLSDCDLGRETTRRMQVPTTSMKPAILTFGHMSVNANISRFPFAMSSFHARVHYIHVEMLGRSGLVGSLRRRIHRTFALTAALLLRSAFSRGRRFFLADRVIPTF
jgi:hypothetical protein